MPHIEDALADRFRPATSQGAMPLMIGRVFEVNRTKHTVSVALRRGGLLRNVQVAKDIIGTNEGSGWLPNVESGPGRIPQFLGSEDKDTYAIVGFLDGDYRFPVVVGFMPPTGFQSAFPDFEVNKYHNGMWVVVDDDGFELSRPDGTFIRIGAVNEQTDVEALNEDKRHPFVKEEGSANTVPSIMISHSSGTSIEITPAGAIIVTKAGGGSFNLGTHQHTETGTTTGGPI